MDMLDPGSPVPLYHQLKHALRLAIEGGQWRPGDQLPTEQALMERYGVSRITVRQALADLVAEGLLYRRRGKGTFVAARAAPIAETLTELTGHLEELRRQGLDPAVTMLWLEVKPMPAAVAAALERQEGAPGWSLRRLVQVDGAPLMVTDVYLPTDLNLKLDEPLVARVGLARLLEERGYVPATGRQRIGAEPAPAQEAALLGLAPGEPVLRVIRVIYSATGTPLAWFKTLYRADRYEYDVVLRRRR
jgi:GntR family transcriptional regulator